MLSKTEKLFLRAATMEETFKCVTERHIMTIILFLLALALLLALVVVAVLLPVNHTAVEEKKGLDY